MDEVRIEVIDYNAEHFEERSVATNEDLSRYRGADTVTWINITGVHDIAVIRRLGEDFGIHPLVLEDIVNVGQRPKLEDYPSHDFVVMKQVSGDDEGFQHEQISLVLGSDWVITVQEVQGDVFETIRERLRRGRPRIRGAGADYLVYALLDVLIDGFFPVLERYGDRIEVLEDALIEDPKEELLAEIHTLRKELLLLRKIAWPHREVIQGLERRESSLIRDETRIFLRDCYDHSLQILDILETYRDLATGMLDIYLSSVSHRMNEVMKVLTVMASIFIPLTFLAGIYGMNFDTEASPWNLPELGWAYGYPAFWVAILVLGGSMVWFFKRKGWL